MFVSAGTVAIKAVQAAAGDIPIVFTQVGEPVAAGFVKSLARPGGNMTGFSHLLSDTTGKRLEILKEIVPGCRTVLVLYDPKNPTSSQSIAVARQSANALRVRLVERHIARRDEALGAILQISKEMADGILVVPDSLVVNASELIIQRARQLSLPVMFHEESWVHRGGLASYGASFVELGAQAARYVDKIRKGIAPGELPVEFPTKFDLVLNMKTATALGVTIPPPLLLRATRIIE